MVSYLEMYKNYDGVIINGFGSGDYSGFAVFRLQKQATQKSVDGKATGRRNAENGRKGQ